MVENTGEKLEHVQPLRLPKRTTPPRRTRVNHHLLAIGVPLQAVQDDRTPSHIPAQPSGCRLLLHPHPSMHREPAVAPRQQRLHHLLADLSPSHQKPKHFRPPQPLQSLPIHPQQVPETPVGQEPTIRHQQVHMRMKTQKLPCRLHEPDSARLDDTLQRSLQAQPPRPPSTPQQFPQQPTIEAKEDPKPLRNRQHHLTVRHLCQQLLLRPLRPQQLPLLVLPTEGSIPASARRSV